MLRRCISRAVILITASLVLTAGCSSGEDAVTTPTTSRRATSTTHRPPGGLGKLTPTGDAPDCPDGFGCDSFSVACAGIARPAVGAIATSEPDGVARGTVVLLSGAAGTSWWASGAGGAAMALGRLRAAGYRVALVRWSTSWIAAAPGEAAGARVLACRPATVIEFIRGSAPPAPAASQGSTCGFCVVGSSSGAIAAVSALTTYDVGIDHVVAISGPANFSVAAGCLRPPGSEDLWYGPEAGLVDMAHGFEPGEGPCTKRDENFRARFAASDQADPSATERDKITVLLGGADRSAAAAQARRWVDRSGVRSEVIADMPHTLQRSEAGLDRLVQELVG